MDEPSDQPTTDEGSERLHCSAKGCEQSPGYAVVWNNPKIHTPDREKVWLACEQHRERLSDFVDRRGFLRRVDPL